MSLLDLLESKNTLLFLVLFQSSLIFFLWQDLWTFAYFQSSGLQKVSLGETLQLSDPDCEINIKYLLCRQG